MIFHGRLMGLLLACLILITPSVLAAEDSDRYFESGGLPVDVVYTDKANGVTARIPWDSSMYVVVQR